MDNSKFYEDAIALVKEAVEADHKGAFYDFAVPP